jgi:hypothetical protein
VRNFGPCAIRRRETFVVFCGNIVAVILAVSKDPSDKSGAFLNISICQAVLKAA